LHDKLFILEKLGTVTVLCLLELILGLLNIEKDEDVRVFEVLDKVQELPLSDSNTIGVSALLDGF
jgi:hypothetical protein